MVRPFDDCCNLDQTDGSSISCNFHDRRRTFVTRLGQAERELDKVPHLLAHPLPMIAQLYAHHYPESLRDSAEILDRITPVSQLARWQES
jgi:hypothetical protein